MLAGINILMANVKYSLGEKSKDIGRKVRKEVGDKIAQIIMPPIDGVLKSLNETVEREVEQAFEEGIAHTILLILPMIGFPPLGKTWPTAPDGKTCLGCLAYEYGITKEAYRALFKAHEERLEAIKVAFSFSEELVQERNPQFSRENYDRLFINGCHFGDENIAYFIARMLTAQWKKIHPVSCPHSSG